jgi:signal transduction histidine kinase/CheY-like chemotaxis protein
VSLLRIVSMPIEVESDIVAVRQRAHLLAEHLQFGRQDQTRIATALSEIARNAFSYAKGGRAEFFIDQNDARQMLLIRVTDRGSGIKDLDEVLEGRYRSPAGMGVGITGARRLLDHFAIESGPNGTRVDLGLHLPERAPYMTPEKLAGIAAILGRSREEDPLHVVREQNRELLQSLDDLRRRQEETEQLSRELEDTNRGVVALYAELDARAEQLREASETKSRFLSNMSHEFRTPLNSILALSGLLLDGVDGSLGAEQQRQIGYIRKSAQELLDLVGDLLDLAKVEAGKLDIRAQRFTIKELFSTLRGALRPLRKSAEVELVFEAIDDLPEMFSDEGKISQILRNLISNALKFTEAGEIHVSAHHDSRARIITFAITDTGIGIASADRERIFEEFSQVESRLQKAAKGTGLGLPLSRRLAGLLGGELWCESELGKGSTFYLSVPVELPGTHVASAQRKNVLIVDDDETFRYVLQQILAESQAYNVVETSDGEAGLKSIRALHPDLVILDLQMPGKDGFAVMRELREDPATAQQRVLVCTSLPLTQDTLARLPPGIPILPKHTISRDKVRSLLNSVFSQTQS